MEKQLAEKHRGNFPVRSTAHRYLAWLMSLFSSPVYSPMVSPMSVRLRAVKQSDLPVFFRDQENTEALEMAAIKPQTSEAFYARWDQILKNPESIAKTILFEETVAGSICCFKVADEYCIGYWVSQAFWGRGIASAAVGLMLQQVPHRPLFAQVAETNLASIRVLIKNGFVITGKRRSPATDRYQACVEVLLELNGNRGDSVNGIAAV